MKKALSILLALMMVLALVPMTFAEGKSATILSDATTLKTGDEIVIVHASTGTAMSATAAATHYRAGVVYTPADGKLSNVADTEIWTVTVNEDGTVKLSNADGVIAKSEDYTSVNWEGVYADWTIKSLGDNIFVMSVVDDGGEKTGTYGLEWFASENRWSVFYNDIESELFQLNLYKVDAEVEEEPTEEPTEVPTSEVPTSEVPTSEVPTTEVPTTEVPTSEAPTSEVPSEEPTAEPTEEPTTGPSEVPELAPFEVTVKLGGGYTEDMKAEVNGEDCIKVDIFLSELPEGVLLSSAAIKVDYDAEQLTFVTDSQTKDGIISTYYEKEIEVRAAATDVAWTVNGAIAGEYRMAVASAFGMKLKEGPAMSLYFKLADCLEKDVALEISLDEVFAELAYVDTAEERVDTELYTVLFDVEEIINNTSDHQPGEPVVENEVPATATTAGSYDLVIYCTVCGEELSRETIAVPIPPKTGESTFVYILVAALAAATAAFAFVVIRKRRTAR